MEFLSRKLKHNALTFLCIGFFFALLLFGHEIVFAKTTVFLVPFGNIKAVGRTIDTIVVHSTYNPVLKKQTFGGALALWKAEGFVAHYAIDSSGHIYQLVPEENIAYHAGIHVVSSGGTDGKNAHSIGVELIYDRLYAPSAAQYSALNALIDNIKKRRPIKYVVGHNEIAPDRKIDPWNFDWKRVRRPQGMIVRPLFQSSITILTEAEQSTMKNASWSEGCPVRFSDLRKVSISYRGFDGKDHTDGVIVVHKNVAKAVQLLFKKMYVATFSIRQIVPAEYYQGDDALIIQEDDTTGFNCRFVAGTSIYSQHAYGQAIDINPRENPFVDESQPSIGDVVKYDPMIPGTIIKNDIPYRAFVSASWHWGGDWKDKKDYQHFSLTGK